MWQNLTGLAGSSPPARGLASMAYDPAISGVILFGGVNDNGIALNDTWEFSNHQWIDLTPDFHTVPSARWGNGLVYDPEYGGLVLFGGRLLSDAVSENSNDTWLFTASGWTEITTANAPSPRTPYGSMFYDPLMHEVVLFGGNTPSSHFNDTWTFASGTWTQLSPAVSPPQMTFNAVWDAGGGYGLLYGGFNALALNGLTWTFSGGSWTNLSDSVGSAPLSTGGSGMMAYDSFLNTAVTYGGSTSSLLTVNSTFAFAEGSWSNFTGVTGAAPFTRNQMTGAYDPLLNGTLIFGGLASINAATPPGYQPLTYVLLDPLRIVATAMPVHGILPLSVEFNATFAPGLNTPAFVWSFGDGSPNATAENVSHRYSRASTFVVNVTAADSAGFSANATLSVLVAAPQSLNATVTPGTGEVSQVFSFYSGGAGGVPPVNYTWKFGDGTSAYGVNVTHTYASSGRFGWSIHQVDALGHSNTSFGNITVIGILSASFAGSPTDGDAPLTVLFTATVTGGEAPLIYNWTFGDGAIKNNGSSSESHTYASGGDYTAALSVTSHDGQNARYEVHITVVAAPSGSGSTTLGGLSLTEWLLYVAVPIAVVLAIVGVVVLARRRRPPPNAATPPAPSE